MQILECLSRKKKISVQKLAEYLDISAITIRRDVSKLESVGLLQRIHGAVMEVPENINEVSVRHRALINIAIKKRIAHYALSFINDGDTIFLDNCHATFDLRENKIIKSQKRKLKAFFHSRRYTPKAGPPPNDHKKQAKKEKKNDN